MLDHLTAFVDRLRGLGIPVSTSEAIDASVALCNIEWRNRTTVKHALAATLIKDLNHRPIFESLFDIYFAGVPDDVQMPSPPGPQPLDDMSAELLEALMSMDLERLHDLAAEAIRRYGGMQPGRPVGGRYYAYRVEQSLRLGELTAELERMLGGGGSLEGGFAARRAAVDADVRVSGFKREVERIIRERLLADRGPDAMARALVRPLPEEVEFLQASSEELAEMRRIVSLLGRRLAKRLSYKHHHAKRGRLDFRKTIRASLGTGGTPASPMFKHRVRMPELVVICDVSGSVAAFSRFALALLYSLSEHFRKVRAFAFVDEIDEVTSYFESADLEEATRRIRTEANVVWIDGHSDYGHSLKSFVTRYEDAVSPRTTVLVLGDARSNFRAPEAGALKQIRERARKLYWLNPEPHRHWNTGDSIASAYEDACDGVYECRNLRQLAAFIERIA